MRESRTSSRGSPVLTRRQFHALAAGAAASLALGPRPAAAVQAPGADLPLQYAKDGRAAAVSLTGVPRGADDLAVETAVERAALAATDFSWLSRGDRVLIKPVCNSGNPYPATTDPVALRAMIRLLAERGAGRIVVGDMSGVEFVRFSKDRLTGSTRELMRRNGMLQAAEAAGAEVVAFEEDGWDGFYEERPHASTSWHDPILLPNLLREMDHVVLMPRCSRHLLAGSTLGLKAAVGWWRHDSRLEYHRDASTFSQKTAESNTVPSLLDKQRLVLTSATQVLTTFGPDQGHVVAPETGLVVASTSLLAHDMVSLAWLLQTRATVPASLKQSARQDPNRSRIFVNVANRVVSYWLGGLGAALATERLARFDLDRVWDDRVLRYAAAAFGGVPRVALVDGDGSVPEAIRNVLAADIALPA
jgi:uncharacterized protein (DUF362 family)